MYLNTILTSVSISWILSMVYDATGGKFVRCQLYLFKKRSERKIISCTVSRKGRREEETEREERRGIRYKTH